MIDSLSPAVILVVGALLIPILQGKLRLLYMLVLPVLSLLQLCMLSTASQAEYEIFNLTLTTLRVDNLSFVFAVIFHIAAFITIIYSLHLRDPLQQVVSLIYAGCALRASRPDQKD